MPFGIINTELKDGGQIPGTEMLIGGSRAGVEAEVDDAHLERITYRARISRTFSSWTRSQLTIGRASKRSSFLNHPKMT